MTSAVSGKHKGQRRLVTEAEPGQLARWAAEARRLGLTWSAWSRETQEDSVSIREVIVYGIKAVGTDQIRFVGGTALSLDQRRKEGFTGKLAEWLATVEWEFVELERSTVTRCVEAEARWVAELGASGMLFNPRTGAAGAAAGAVTVAVGLKRETHSAAVELACAGHWSLGAFVELAVEQLVARMKAGQAVEVRAPGVPVARTPRWCVHCGLPQSSTSNGWACANGEHGGADSVFSAVEARAIRDNSLSEPPGFKPSAPRDRARVVATVPAEPLRRQPNARVGSAVNPRSAADRSSRDDDDLDEASA